MKNLETITLDEMINSELIASIIEKEDQDLKEAGWNYEDVKEFAKLITNN